MRPNAYRNAAKATQTSKGCLIAWSAPAICYAPPLAAETTRFVLCLIVAYDQRQVDMFPRELVGADIYHGCAVPVAIHRP